PPPRTGGRRRRADRGPGSPSAAQTETIQLHPANAGTAVRNRASSASASAPDAIGINTAHIPGRTTAGWVVASTMLGVDPNAAAIVVDALFAAATLEKSPTRIESPAGDSGSDAAPIADVRPPERLSGSVRSSGSTMTAPQPTSSRLPSARSRRISQAPVAPARMFQSRADPSNPPTYISPGRVRSRRATFPRSRQS